MQDTQLYKDLAGLGIRHKALRPTLLAPYDSILGAAEVRRVAGPHATRGELAQAAYEAIDAAIANIDDARIRLVGEAAMCLLPDSEGTLAKQRLQLLQAYPALKPYVVDAEFYKYHRRAALRKIYDYLTHSLDEKPAWQTPEPDTNGRESVLSVEQRRSITDLQRAIIQLMFGAVGTTFISRFNDRLSAERIATDRLDVRPDQEYLLPGDLLLPAVAAYISALARFREATDSWLPEHLTAPQHELLLERVMRLAIVRSPVADDLALWHAQRSSDVDQHDVPSCEQPGPRPPDPELEGQVRNFYLEHWLPWLGNQSPRYATEQQTDLDTIIARCAGLSRSIIELLDVGFWADDERSVAVDHVDHYYNRLPIIVTIGGQFIRQTIWDYFALFTVDDWHPVLQIDQGTRSWNNIQSVGQKSPPELDS